MRIRNLSLGLVLSTILICGAGEKAWADDGLVITRQDCARISAHRPEAGVAYQPGRDVYGKPVSPADLDGGSGIKLPEEITLYIGIDLAEKYGIGAGGDFTGEGIVGRVTVVGDAVYFNGKRIDDRDRHAIAEACRRSQDKR